LVPVLLLNACGSDSALDNSSSGFQGNVTPIGANGSSAAFCTAQSTEAVDLVQPGDWVSGPEDYSVTLIEYGDFQ
jgi:hypothetical protein